MTRFQISVSYFLCSDKLWAFIWFWFLKARSFHIMKTWDEFWMTFWNFKKEYVMDYEYLIWYDADNHVFKWETNCIDLKPFGHPDHTPAQICISWYIFTHYLTGHHLLITKDEAHCGSGVHGDSDMHYSLFHLEQMRHNLNGFWSFVWPAFVAFQNI